MMSTSGRSLIVHNCCVHGDHIPTMPSCQAFLLPVGIRRYGNLLASALLASRAEFYPVARPLHITIYGQGRMSTCH